MVRMLLLAGILLMMSSPAFAASKPFPGKASTWNTFERFDFTVDGKDAIVVVPAKPAPGRPWLWRAEFFGAFPNADIELVKRGWHLVYINVQEQYGSPHAMAAWEKFYEVLVKDHELHAKPGILGMSRGGMYALAWGMAHPDKTLAIDLDNAVCNPKGLIGNPKVAGSPEWKNLLKAYGFTRDADVLAYKNFPIDNLGRLAEAKVPLLLVYGDSDKTLPHTQQSQVLWDRYTALKGPIERQVKVGGDHHPHSLPDPTPIVEFFERAMK
ncbi:MAG: alpha/beta hydrolase [Planctomycetaceae bacterium]|nr:alpha/beta hydrolase [Planctomycetaceae bacterium]